MPHETHMRPERGRPIIRGTARDQEIAARLAYDDALDTGMGHEEAAEIAMTHLGSDRLDKWRLT